MTNEHFRVDYDARLVEEAVLLALRGRPDERAFHRERNPLYDVADAEARDAAFLKLHAAWFVRLNLDRPIHQAIAERPLLTVSVRRCAVTTARSKKDEGADLFVSPAEEGQGEIDRRSIGIQVRPESLLDPDRLLDLLRHELLHVEDMLNPHFGYEPSLPHSEVGPAYDRLLQDRYRALWDATIDGRLMRAGMAPASVRDRRLQDFARAFPMLSERTPECFSRFFDGASPAHADLVAFAQNPDRPEACPTINLSRSHAAYRGARCPVCRFPTYDFEPAPERLPPDLIARVREDFPDWRPTQGICPQCAELYRARPLSMSAVALLPKIS